MALIALLVINLLIINLNFIEAAHEEDTAVNSFLPWLRKWCAICEKLVMKVTEAYNNFYKTLFGSMAPSRPSMKQSVRPRKLGSPASPPVRPRKLGSPESPPSPRQGQAPVTDPPFIPTRPHRDIYEIEKIYMADLESSVFLILNDHLSQFDKIEGVDNLSAISYVLWYIYVDFPNYPRVPSAAKKVYDYLNDRPALDREELRRVAVAATKEFNLQGGRYFSCGDLAQPEECGLWLLFHMISIHYTLRTNSSRTYGPVPYILQYIFKFNDKMIPGVVLKMQQLVNQTDHKEAALLLWDWHNEAVKRQYPSFQKCPECYNGPPDITRQKLFNYLAKFFTTIEFNLPNTNNR